MAPAVWIEMPVVDGETPAESPRPKYEIRGSAALVYHGRHVYVNFEDENEAAIAADLPGTRQLTASDLRELDATLPVPLTLMAAEEDHETGDIGLGDVVAWIAAKLHVEQCHGCRKRRRWLNRVVLWRRHKRNAEYGP